MTKLNIHQRLAAVMGEGTTAELVARLLDYDAETGRFTWLARDRPLFKSQRAFATWNARYAGKPALCYHSPTGYLTGRIFATEVYAHRIAWLLKNGAWPVGVIDHINRDKTDNRIANLRDVPQAENCRNVGLRRDNKSGVAGVSFSQRYGTWAAEIGSGGYRKRLGTFNTKEAAAAARMAAEDRANVAG